MNDPLLALARICRRLGGRLAIVSQKKFYDLLDAGEEVCMPGTVGSRGEYGIYWERKIIYAVRGTTHIGFVIHEAGHVFADRHPPDDAKCAEWEWLGWEIAVAQRIGVMNAWSRQNGNYHLGEGIRDGVGKRKDWAELTAAERRAVAADRLEHARKIGVIAEDGTPRSVR